MADTPGNGDTKKGHTDPKTESGGEVRCRFCGIPYYEETPEMWVHHESGWSVCGPCFFAFAQSKKDLDGDDHQG